MFLIVEDIVLVDSLHVLVLILNPANDSLRVPFEMLSEAVVIGAFEDAHHRFDFRVQVDSVRRLLPMGAMPLVLLGYSI